MNENELINYIKTTTVHLQASNDNWANSLRWLSNEIYEGKAPLTSNTVHFIIVKLPQNKRRANQAAIDYFNVYVVGDFLKAFTPVLKVAEAFADFYIEMGILPLIIPLPKKILMKNAHLLQKIKNGILLYERR